MAVTMTSIWVVVVVVGVATIILRAVGPVLLGGKELPPRLVTMVTLLAPAVLAALVVTQAVAGDRRIVLDARLFGLAAAGLAIWRRAPVIVVVVLAAATTATARAVA
jgi:branched chain amino acid efflux pump